MQIAAAGPFDGDPANDELCPLLLLGEDVPDRCPDGRFFGTAPRGPARLFGRAAKARQRRMNSPDC